MMIHRLAWVTLISLIVLIFVGATVRVTGSGLGCPDWPTCWGCIIPPTNAEQIDVEKLDIDKFKRHAARHGIDPATITRDTVLDSFDPVHTWIEFGNRLTSLPLGFAALFLALFSFRAKTAKCWIVALSWFSLLDVIVNAVMGAMVVRSGLKPGIITLHMALAFLLIIVLVTVIWLSRSQPGTLSKSQNAPAEGEHRGSRRLLVVSLIFFVCLIGEGLMGSQVREQTDQLAKMSTVTETSSQEGAEDSQEYSRAEWIEQLESTLIYKVHRSFSWTLLVTAFLIFFWSRPNTETDTDERSRRSLEPKFILGIVIAMMVMGVIMAHVAVLAVVQLLHVGFTAILLAVTWHWILSLAGSQSPMVRGNLAADAV